MLTLQGSAEPQDQDISNFNSERQKTSTKKKSHTHNNNHHPPTQLKKIRSVQQEVSDVP